MSERIKTQKDGDTIRVMGIGVSGPQSVFSLASRKSCISSTAEFYYCGREEKLICIFQNEKFAVPNENILYETAHRLFPKILIS